MFFFETQCINMFSTIWSEAGVLDFITHVLSNILCTRLAKAHYKITINRSCVTPTLPVLYCTGFHRSGVIYVETFCTVLVLLY